MAMVGSAITAAGSVYGYNAFVADKVENLNWEQLRNQGIQSVGQLAVEFAGDQVTLENCQHATATFSEQSQDQSVKLSHPTYGTFTIPVAALGNYCPDLFD